MKPKVKIYTDGSSLGNPGNGGWGAILVHGDNKKEMSGFAPDVTNNQMELTAVIEALKTLKKPCHVFLTSDSKYVLDSISKWMDGWERKNWNGVKNLDLMKELNELRKIHSIECNWIKGHTGHPENERCDKLAVTAAKKGKPH